MEKTILLQGKRGVKKARFGKSVVHCFIQPFFAMTGDHFELGVECSNKMGFVFRVESLNHPFSIDILSMYRAIRLIDLLSEIDYALLGTVYIAASLPRKWNDPVHLSVVRLIGQVNYETVFRETIPEEVINLIIWLHAHNYPIMLGTITKEIGKTIAWQKEFEHMGINHPQRDIAARLAWLATTKRYQADLDAYALFARMDKRSLVFEVIKGYIVACIEKGLEERGRDIVLGVAIVTGFHPLDSWAIEKLGAGMPLPLRVRHTAVFLVSHYNHFPQLTYEQLLGFYLKAWETMPVVTPILPG